MCIKMLARRVYVLYFELVSVLHPSEDFAYVSESAARGTNINYWNAQNIRLVYLQTFVGIGRVLCFGGTRVLTLRSNFALLIILLLFLKFLS
jgi:hypothetical protein